MSDYKNDYGQPIGPELEAWSERPSPQRIVIRGRYCRLEPVGVEDHASDLFAAYMEAPDNHEWTYLFVERPETEVAFRDYLQKLAASEQSLHFAIVDSGSERAVGTAALMRIEPTHGAIEVGSIVYSSRLKKTRAGTEAMYLLMRYVFEDLGFRRYEWKCDSLNAPSRAAATRYGFTYEGTFRNAIVYKGRNRDTSWYSIIDTEWPSIQSAFDAWLDPQNFDKHGLQKQSLSEIRKLT